MINNYSKMEVKDDPAPLLNQRILLFLLLLISFTQIASAQALVVSPSNTTASIASFVNGDYFAGDATNYNLPGSTQPQRCYSTYSIPHGPPQDQTVEEICDCRYWYNSIPLGPISGRPVALKEITYSFAQLSASQVSVTAKVLQAEGQTHYMVVSLNAPYDPNQTYSTLKHIEGSQPVYYPIPDFTIHAEGNQATNGDLNLTFSETVSGRTYYVIASKHANSGYTYYKRFMRHKAFINFAPTEINVKAANNVSIADNDLTPSNSDLTIYAKHGLRQYTIENTGGLDLVVSNITFGGSSPTVNGTISGISLPATVPSGSSVTFNGHLDPLDCGDTEIIITNTDTDEGTYNFKVSKSVGNNPTLITEDLCNGSGGSISVVPVAGATYNWSTAATTSSIMVNTPGSYWVQRTVNGCTSPQTTATVGSKSTVTPNITVGPIQCNGTRMLTANNIVNGASIEWSTGSTDPSIQINSSGSYWVRQTYDGCTSAKDTETTTASVPSGNSLALGFDYFNCNSNGYVDITVSGITAGASKVKLYHRPANSPNATYQYYNEILTSSTTASQGFYFGLSVGNDGSIHPGDEWVATQVVGACESGFSSSKQIYYLANGNFNYTLIKEYDCNGSVKIGVKDVSPSEGVTYRWNHNSATDSVITITEPASYGFGGRFGYELIISIPKDNGSGKCNRIVNIPIYKDQASITSLGLSQSPVNCLGKARLVANTSAPTADDRKVGEITWSTGDATSDFVSGVYSSTIYVDQPGTYTVTGKSFEGGCAIASNSITVTAADLGISPTPVPQITSQALPNGKVRLTVSGEPNATFVWSTGATSPAITVSISGTYTVYQTIGVCSSTAASVTVNAADIQATEVCPGSSTSVTLNPSVNGQPYYLEDAITGILIDGPVVGNGSGISFNTAAISTNTSYNVVAGSETGKGIAFNGTNGYTTVPHNAAYNVTDAFSIAFWFKSDDLGQSQKYLFNHDNRVAVIYEYGNDEIELYAMEYTGDNPRTGSQMTLNDTEWHHIAYTYDGTTLKGYVDGTQEISVARNFTLGSVNAPVIFGAANSGIGYVEGKLDDVQFWNIGRSAVEIAESMAGCLAGSETGLIGYWKMNEGSGNQIADLSSIGSSATAFHTSWTHSPVTCGQASSVATFTDASDSRGVVSYDAAHDVSDAFTVAMWFRSDNNSQTQNYLFNRDNRFSMIYGYAVDTVEFFAGAYNGTDDPRVGSKMAVGDNEWHHFAYTYDGTNFRGYKDGVVQFSLAKSFSIQAINTSIFIGAANATVANIDGGLAHVQLWNKGSSDAEILKVMNNQITGSETGLVGYWKLNEGSGTTATDYSSIGNNASLTGVSWGKDADGYSSLASAAYFNGSSTYVSAPFNPEHDVTDNFTVSLWFKSDDLNQTNNYLINRNNRMAILYGYSIDTVEFFAGGSTGDDPRSGSQMAIEDKEWHQITYTYDGSNLKGYIDGVERISVAKSFTLGSTNSPITIGAANASLGNAHGTIDEVKFWKVARTAIQVANDMDNCASANQTGLIGYWNFNEGQGLFTKDHSSIGSDGLVYNHAWKNSTVGCITERGIVGNVVVPTSILFTGIQFDTACSSYTWRGNVYNSSGTYRDTIAGAGANGCDSIAILELLIDCGASKRIEEELVQESDLVLYPNPGHNHFAIKGLKEGRHEMQVFSIAGSLMLTKTISQNDNRIDVSQLPAGMYLVRIDQEVIRFVKNKF